LLKLGGYGLIRLCISVFFKTSILFAPFGLLLAFISIIYASLLALRELDLKRIIAYSSIAHMSMALIGLFSFNLNGLGGSIYLMIAHGIVSSALFYCIGILYDRFKTRLIFSYGGIEQIMPVFIKFFFVFTVSNFGFPLSSNFIGELMIIFGTIYINVFFSFLLGLTTLLTVGYSLLMYTRIALGTLPRNFKEILHYTDIRLLDINNKEFIILFTLLITNIVLGIHPI